MKTKRLINDIFEETIGTTKFVLKKTNDVIETLVVTYTHEEIGRCHTNYFYENDQIVALRDFLNKVIVK